MKRWIVAAVVVAAAGAGLYLYSRGHKPSGPKFETTKVTRGSITARVTATGTLSALVTVQVGSQVSGRIQKLFADFNSPVKKGQVIAKIDPQLFLAAVEQGQANVAVQTGQVSQAKVQFRSLDLIRLRDRELRKQNLIAQQQLDTDEAAADAAKANIEVQEAQLLQAKATLHQAQVNLDYTTILSPTDGTVISRAVDVGQTVAASFSAPVLFTIAQDLTKMQVDTSVAEADVGKLVPKMTAIFQVDAYPNEKFKGTVRQIRNAPQTVQNVVTYDAVIDVDNTDLKLKPGMTANVTFVYAQKDDVLRVPNAALRFRPPPEMLAAREAPSTAGGAVAAEKPRRARPDGAAAGPTDRRTVWVLRGERPAPVSIRVGVSDGTLSEVLPVAAKDGAGDDSALKEGDAVITEATMGKGGPGGPGGTPFRGRPF
jgi:HlyD family secretion protein